MDYKDTLLLPYTDFAMRANLSEGEPKIFEKWFKDNYAYEKMKAKRKDAVKSFILHDGPPYANGHIHLGHALNKILKETIIKTHYFNAEAVRFTPGWDCHGLPIEQQVEIKLAAKKKELSIKELRELCRKHAEEFIDIQRAEFKSLGVIADWDRPYITMDFKFEADIYRLLCELAKKGLLVQRHKPVFWSWAARSALAEAEVEYEDKEDYSIFVAFDLDESSCAKLGVSKAAAVIWTTTPWTLPANQAIALNPNEGYVLTREGLIFAKPLLESLAQKELTKGEIVKEFKASELENLNAINPLNQRSSRLILGEHVLMDGGTGLVHTAPGHGEDDYYACLKYDIKMIMPVDDGGLYDETLRTEKLMPESLLDEFIGLHIFKANERILELLGKNLLSSSKFIHSYPFCWRTHKPVIFRATKQYFIAMDEKKLSGQSLRELALDEISKTKFYPQSGIKRIGSMVQKRPDWCISRQRAWGTPIAFFKDKTSGELILDEKLLEHIANIFEKQGADAWWQLSTEELLPAHLKYDPSKLEKIYDILDVWFDSGSTWNGVLRAKNYEAGDFPASMYLEGSDQHRGWFQSSLLLSCAVNEKAPYKAILTHGFTIDEKGQKMSKSKGNVIDPKDIARDYGVEILRLWILLSDFTSDLKISQNILKQVAEQYRKIRNTIRFLLANTNDLEFLETKHFKLLDQWILARASKLFKEVKQGFDNYEYAKGFNALLNFLTSDLSGIYLDVCKDRLYCEAKSSEKRLAAQSAMALIAKRLLILLAPSLTYTVDEALGHCNPIIKGRANDVFDLVFEEELEYEFKEDSELLLESREKFLEQIDALKKEKKIKSTLELSLQSSSKELLSYDLDELEDWFLVSKIEGLDENSEALAEFSVGDLKFKLVRTRECKCPRCWKFKAKAENEPCTRCKEVLNA
ncbi:isoleucine--tRNA ligase [Campylobacter sp. MIT 99-7217]|uniref:isoleucine--tRNA ligase n=1 Tax=Campylobacter sp. MIT 99-7217 TaxID=535091 RepID=UPI00115B0C43|nr:isoleucine--tRNA ligase [Campylobacter sp. MIT 99-7217]TQR33048.1 isoleucine--tRNA ligase [Campylobacter sp. MIT 99-7217]